MQPNSTIEASRRGTAAAAMSDTMGAPAAHAAGDARGDAMPPDAKASYGIDSPGVVLTFGMLAFAFTFAGIFIGSAQGLGAGIGPWGAALLCLAASAYMVRSSKVVKPRLWRSRLDDLSLTGTERALDVGCGRGLVTVELAKRLPAGEVVGIDIWRNRDQSGNSRRNAMLNVQLEGVAERVRIVDADMTDLPFEDGEFDIVTAGLALHNLPLAAGRRDAMHELMRVTRPGGRVVIVDSGKTVELEAWLRDGEWDDVTRSRPTLASYPAVRTVTATKPGRGKPQLGKGHKAAT